MEAIKIRFTREFKQGVCLLELRYERPLFGVTSSDDCDMGRWYEDIRVRRDVVEGNGERLEHEDHRVVGLLKESIYDGPSRGRVLVTNSELLIQGHWNIDGMGQLTLCRLRVHCWANRVYERPACRMMSLLVSYVWTGFAIVRFCPPNRCNWNE